MSAPMVSRDHNGTECNRRSNTRPRIEWPGCENRGEEKRNRNEKPGNERPKERSHVQQWPAYPHGNLNSSKPLGIIRCAGRAFRSVPGFPLAVPFAARRLIPYGSLAPCPSPLERTTLMLTRMLLCAALAVAFVAPLTAEDKPNTAAVASQKDPKRHERFLEDIKKMNGKIDVVFLGDSITD